MEDWEKEVINQQLKAGKEIDKTIVELKQRDKNDELRVVLGKTYEQIIEVLNKYCDLRKEYYPLIAVWIIGTYIHNQFSTYPYLFLNAMRGSGKTRLLKLIAELSHNGILITSLREATLFRMAKGRTLCIDEFEGVNKKENAPLRELLNASYKKGMKIPRMKRIRTQEGDDYVLEFFEPYTPICMANIWGMEEVLGDRCLTMILERSACYLQTKLTENYSEDLLIKSIKANFSMILVYLCSYFSEVRYMEAWNMYIQSKYLNIYTLTTLTSLTTLITPTKDDKLLDLFNKIDATNINGRNLELLFPLLIIADFISTDVFESILATSKKIEKERKIEEMAESKDVQIFEFVSLREDTEPRGIRQLISEFRTFIGELEDDDRWLNEKWFGRALKRLDLIIDKRRLGSGIQILLNINKAKEKIKIFQQTKQ